MYDPLESQTEPVAPVGVAAPATPPKQWVHVIANGIDLRAELKPEQVEELLATAYRLVGR